MPFVDGMMPGETPEQYAKRARKPDSINRDQALEVGIEAAVDNFDANRRRLICLAHLPAEVFHYALRFQKLAQEIKAGKLPEEGPYFTDDPPHSLFSPLTKALRDCVEKKREFPALSQEDYACYLQVAGVAALGNPEMIGPSIEAFAVSVLSQAWQTFEVLTEDLLNAAVSNNRDRFPREFAPPVEILGGLVGKKVGIRDQYRQAFGDSAERITAILQDEHLDYMSAIRNLFLHNSGKTDEDYLRRVEPLTLDKVIRPQLGKQFPLTGQLTSRFGDHCLGLGMSLLYEVYHWIMYPPPD